jgi:hypothetical protein
MTVRWVRAEDLGLTIGSSRQIPYPESNSVPKILTGESTGCEVLRRLSARRHAAWPAEFPMRRQIAFFACGSPQSG